MRRSVMVSIGVALLVVVSSAGLLISCKSQDDNPIAVTEAQVDLCRSEMYLNPEVEITPLGFDSGPSGRGHSIYFKFETACRDLAKLFNSQAVDTFRIKAGYIMLIDERKDLAWWDAKGKVFSEGTFQLPNQGRMQVLAERIDDGYLMYIAWHER